MNLGSAHFGSPSHVVAITFKFSCFGNGQTSGMCANNLMSTTFETTMAIV